MNKTNQKPVTLKQLNTLNLFNLAHIFSSNTLYGPGLIFVQLSNFDLGIHLRKGKLLKSNLNPRFTSCY